ncbi:hypothetical protein RHMOL_Rhmol10G0221200 [Rhododendron molle]|uniref:Uncharacterized protein n=1 Tax=Rhododendron molle TaxID=49168 RepID=A0ACC0M4W2_RHOML|nr:hypothetical protein RHMOL_Rhmol10G0221200 [Rhododendron molle]
MNTAFQDMLAVSCPKFVGVEIVLLKNLSQQRGSNYYLLPADENCVLVAKSRPHNGKKFEYVLDWNFIICYCSMFRIGTRFRWKKYKQFQNWLNSFINNAPRFIQPHLQVMNLLDPPIARLAFRQFGNELRFMKKLLHGDLLALELRTSIKDFLNEIGLHRLCLTTGQSTWEVEYIDGFLVGQGWNNFIAAQNLRCYDTLVFSVDWELKMHARVFDELEKTYNWYSQHDMLFRGFAVIALD